MKKILPFFISFVFVVLDQLVKLLCVLKLKPINTKCIIDNFFYLTYVENRGAAFGMLKGARWIFVIIAIIATTLGIYYYNKLKNEKFVSLYRVSIILILSGAIGNMIDRVFRGYVVDMFHFIFWGKDFAVFNIADIYVCVGTFFLALAIIFSDFKNK